MDATLSQILTYLYATLQKNEQLERELAVLRSGLPIHEVPATDGNER